MNSTNFYLTFTAMLIASFLFGCTTAMELDTNGYYSHSQKPQVKYCQQRVGENQITFVPCDEVKHDDFI